MRLIAFRGANTVAANEPSAILFTDATPEMIATLEHERDQIDARIRCLSRNRDAITTYLGALRDCRSDAPQS